MSKSCKISDEKYEEILRAKAAYIQKHGKNIEFSDLIQVRKV